MSLIDSPAKPALKLNAASQQTLPDSGAIRGFFDGIASHYDFLNSLLSFSLDERWRRRSLEIMVKGNEQTLLDLGTGTGRFLKIFLEKKKWQRAVGLDFSSAMLERAAKIVPAAELVSADFHRMPFADKSFDLIVSSFALRSVKDMPRFLAETHRLLAPGGRAGFLCLTRPNNFFNLFYMPYLKIYLPLVGRLLSGNAQAYKFLSDSIQVFQDPAVTARQMRDAGFRQTAIHSFTFGSATLIVGVK